VTTAELTEIRRKRVSLGLSATPDPVRGDMAAVERWRKLLEKQAEEKKGKNDTH
jgi:hypothetical protein